MKLVDYTGKLNDHKSYLDMLSRLEDKTDYIEIVLRDNAEQNEIVEYFQTDIILSKTVSEWWGTKTSGKQKLFRIKSSKELFKFLSKYETFCKYHIAKGYEPNFYEDGSGIYYDVQECTDFGWDDILFYDDNENILLYTTTHECYITINDNLIS